MLVEIEPPLVRQARGSGEEVVSRLVLATRHEGYTLFPVFPIRKRPLSVYIYIVRLLDESGITSGWFGETEVEHISWGVLFRDREDAEREVLSARESLAWGRGFMDLGDDGKPLEPAE